MLEEIKIYSYYLGGQEIGEYSYCSPFPANMRGGKIDNTPSFSLRISETDGKLRWREWAIGTGGDAWDLIMKLESHISNHSQALSFFDRFIKPIEIEKKAIQPRSKINSSKFSVIERKPFTEAELAYWQQFAIQGEQLRREHIYPSGGVTFEGNDKIFYQSTEEEPKFIYDFFPNTAKFSSIKVYSPLAVDKKSKWRNWYGSNPPITETYDTTLPEQADILIIVSSRKDKMVVNNAGFAADSPLSETSFRKGFDLIYDEYNIRFKKVYICMDGDGPGRSAENEISNLYPKWKKLNMRYPVGTKDPADIVKQFGTKVLKALIEEKLTN